MKSIYYTPQADFSAELLFHFSVMLFYWVVTLTLLELVLVRCFSYTLRAGLVRSFSCTARAGFSEDFVSHSSNWF